MAVTMRLRFAAGEKRRAVRARKPAGLDRNRTNFGEPAAVGTPAVVQNVVAEDALFQLIEQFAGFEREAPADLRIAFDRRVSSVRRWRCSFRSSLVLDIHRLTQFAGVFLGDLFEHVLR